MSLDLSHKKTFQRVKRMTKEMKKEALSQDKILQSLKSFGPNLKEIPSFIDCLPYATFNKQERLGKKNYKDYDNDSIF